MRRELGLPFLLASVLVACTPSHTLNADGGSDAPVDADVVTSEERVAIEYIEASCRAWIECPTGLEHGEYVYAHGYEQCMREYGQYYIDYLRFELRNDTLEVDATELARCETILATGACPSPAAATYSWYYLPSCEWWEVFVPARRVGLNAPCGFDRATCDDGLQCGLSSRCGLVCLERSLGQPCDPLRNDCQLPASCSPRGLCEVYPTVLRGEGHECGVRWDEFEHGLCEPGTYCAEDPGFPHCVRIPRAGETCLDGLCAPGTFCVAGACRAGPFGEGEPCGDAHWETDPCDRSNGFVCRDGQCARVGRALGDPCIIDCDDGRQCVNGTCMDPSVRPEPLPDGSPCTPSDACASSWCQPETGLCGAPTPPCE